jgi:hypothetical protein
MFALYAFAPLVALAAEIGDWLETKIGSRLGWVKSAS